ncbi:type II toxin-antitoxin system PemK/MazF family toxin [Microbacterium sp. NPDC089695]|uniref:type II toxin-antitoxin system PemK/MazF family toxin n=1 Tax=Microbacterium sp. NPDC089695 TaxID=3364198 RepID=UPI0037FB4339
MPGCTASTAARTRSCATSWVGRSPASAESLRPTPVERRKTLRKHPLPERFPSFDARSAGATGLDRDSKAQAEQVRTVAVARIVRPVGWVPAELMAAVDEALRLHLSL